MQVSVDLRACKLCPGEEFCVTLLAYCNGEAAHPETDDSAAKESMIFQLEGIICHLGSFGDMRGS